MRTQLIAVQSSLAWWGKMLPLPSSLGLPLPLCSVRKTEGLLRLWGGDLPFRPTSLPAGVQWLSINQGLLTAETTLSHQHAISWVTDSTLTALHPQFKQSCSQPPHPPPPHTTTTTTLTVSLYLPACLPHLELLRNPNHPGTVRLKTKAGVIITSSSLPSIWGEAEKEGEDLSRLGTKSVSRSSSPRTSSGGCLKWWG